MHSGLERGQHLKRRNNINEKQSKEESYNTLSYMQFYWTFDL